MIRYLSLEEKKNCRFLWEEAFPEDSRPFDDYYFKEKIKDNRILVKEDDGAIVSMIHQNPYLVSLGSKTWKLDYIVGVATDVTKRKQGHMRDLISHMLKEMNREGMPFSFLMPAAERIYLPFDFTYIFDQPIWELKPDARVEKVRLDAGSGDGAGRKALSDWLAGWMEKNYQVYCVRNDAYIRRWELELASEAGDVYLLCNRPPTEREGDLLYNRPPETDRICGVQSYWGLDERKQRALICDEEMRTEAEKAKPAVMGRIVCLQNFITCIRLKDEAPRDTMEVCLRIRDGFIPDNDGIFCWKLDKSGSVIRRQQGEPQLVLSVGELTGWLFGYRPLEEILEASVTIPDWCRLIQVLDGVFLDEVV